MSLNPSEVVVMMVADGDVLKIIIYNVAVLLFSRSLSRALQVNFAA